MMGSTGEPDRKRRHFNSISPTGATAKKQPLVPLSEDKKLDTAVLKFQNQKLVQKLESQKVECLALENKFNLLRSKQLPYDKTSALVDKSWKELVDKVEARSMQPKDFLGHRRNLKQHSVTADSALLTPEDVFLSRLLETGATQSSSSNSTPDQMEEDQNGAGDKTENILRNIVTAIDGMWRYKDELCANVVEELPEDGSGRQKVSDNLLGEVKSLRSAISDIHLKHKSLVREIQIHQDTDAKNKAELKRLKGDLESTIVELEESKKKLAVLKAATDAAKGAILPVLLGNKHVVNDRTRDKQKDLHDMESLLKELLDQASSRQLELKHLHEERVEILKQLASLQNTLKNVKCVSSSQAYVLVRDQIVKAKGDIGQYQALFEKLQVEKDNLAWHEKEVNLKTDVVDVLQKSYAVADSRITELETEIQKQIDGKNLIEAKLEEASKEAGRKDIIAEFKALVSSFPEDMGSMQTQLSKYKEAASDVHSLRADVRSLSNVLDRKVKELEALSDRSVAQVAEVQKLRAVIHDLEESDSELQLILEMYMRESSDSRDVLEARNSEYKAWAHVQSLNSSLDEHKLELRVKTAIEDEAMSQQRLAAAEAEIADLRQKLERSKREKARLSDVLKSKHEQNEAYLSEIETIGQAYDDMQTQNQQLLQQITERDDYNIKLVLEGVRARQLLDALLMEKETVERRAQQGNALLNFYEMNTAKIEDQLKSCSEQVQKLSEERIQNTLTLDTTRRRLLDIRKSSQHLTESQEESQNKLVKSRIGLSELQIELETERFEKKRVEEELEVVRRKASRLRSELEGSSVVEKLQQELSEYREILKCSICLDRRKEVVITKCYHLFCNLCIQKIIETRHRKCPVCAASFGANDVKPVYI